MTTKNEVRTFQEGEMDERDIHMAEMCKMLADAIVQHMRAEQAKKKIPAELPFCFNIDVSLATHGEEKGIELHFTHKEESQSDWEFAQMGSDKAFDKDFVANIALVGNVKSMRMVGNVKTWAFFEAHVEDDELQLAIINRQGVQEMISMGEESIFDFAKKKKDAAEAGSSEDEEEIELRDRVAQG